MIDRAIDLLRRSLDSAPRVGCVCPWDEDGTPIGEHSQVCGSFIGVFKEIQDFLRDGSLPGDPVVVEPVVDPLPDGELAVGQRCSVTLELCHEGDGLWLAGESLRVHPAPGSPSDAPGFAGSFLMVEPHGPGSYTASVRGVVKSVVRLADG